MENYAIISIYNYKKKRNLIPAVKKVCGSQEGHCEKCEIQLRNFNDDNSGEEFGIES